MSLRAGIDLVAITSVEESIAEHGARYLERVFTAAERDACRTPGGHDAARLAACFAAKEAVAKALRADPGAPLPWTEIEVLQDAAGGVEIRLSGAAEALARRAGAGHLAVSVTREGDLAAAVVIAGSPA